jgi:hypothetical protein
MRRKLPPIPLEVAVVLLRIVSPSGRSLIARDIRKDRIV